MNDVFIKILIGLMLLGSACGIASAIILAFCHLVYWNKKAGQIVTKGGKCLYDREEIFNNLSSLSTRVGDWESRNVEIDKYNRKVEIDNCDLDGHVMVFKEHRKCQGWCVTPSYISSIPRDLDYEYVFKCSKCGYENSKAEKGLTDKESKALKDLGIL